MYKYFEYQCQSEACLDSHIEERFVHSSDENVQHCLNCQGLMTKYLGATRGFVKGTATPCINN
jgi:hypothetical protein